MLRRAASRKVQNPSLHGGIIMITKNPMQLKSFIKNKANEYNISPQLCMQNYMLERLLERVSLSSYKNNFKILICT